MEQGTHSAEGLIKMQSILDFIAAFTLKYHYPPTFDEINSGVGLSGRSHVHHYLHFMRSLGLVNFKDRKSRTIILLKEVIE